MDEFTNEEKHRIDVLYGTDFKDITADDVKLIARYEAYKAKNDAKLQAEIEAIKTESETKLAYALKQQTQAMSNLDELHARALLRLDRLEKRERETIEQAQAKDGLHDGI